MGRILVASAVALAVGLLVSGCDRSESAAVATRAPEPIAVSAIEVTREQLVEPIRCTGTIASAKTTDIGPRVDGIIEEIFVKVGDRVEAGAALFRTRQVDYRTRVKRAEHARRRARGEARKAHADLKRFQDLHASGVVAQEQLDTARAQVEITEGRLGEAETTLEEARQQLEDTVVRAPYDGAITQRWVDEGAMMRTLIMGAGSRVVQIMKTDVVLAIVQVPEVHLARIHVGTRARVDIDGLDRAFDSFVFILNDRVDPQSRAVEVRLLIENPDLTIKPGLFATAELFPEGRAVTVVDRRAVLGSEANHWVYRAAYGKAVRRPVRLRELDVGRMEVLEGLDVGTQVLVGPNLARLVDGSPLSLKVAHVDR